MSSTIDQRVVEMKFNNQDFETGAKQTLSTIEKLKTAFNFGGVTKGLDSVKTANSRLVKEKTDRYVKAAAKYRGVSEDKIRKRMQHKEVAKAVGKILLTVGAYKLRTDPKARATVAKYAAKGGKLVAKGLGKYASHRLDKMQGIVDAPGYQVMGEVRNVAGYLKG